MEAEKKQRYKRGENPKSKANLKPFEKGQSGNPAGLPVGTKNRATVLRKWTEVNLDIVNPITKEKQRGTVEDEVILALIRKARSGDVAAIKEVQDSLYGKIPNKDELTGANGGAIEVATRVIKPTNE